MGLCSSTFTKPKELTILVIGLDNSGKSTLCGAIKGDVDPVTVPTVGFASPIRRRLFAHDVVLYDLGGGARIRGVWPTYFAEIHGVVFVVDAADSARLPEAAKELEQALLHPMVVGKPVLVLANKQDLPHAASEVDLAQGVGLDSIATLCRHHISGCIARATLNGGVIDPRIHDGLHWLIEAVSADYAPLNERRRREMAEFAAADAERKRRQAEAYVLRQEELRKQKEEAAAAATAAPATATPASGAADAAAPATLPPSQTPPAAAPAGAPAAATTAAAAVTAPAATAAAEAAGAGGDAAAASVPGGRAAGGGMPAAPVPAPARVRPPPPMCSVCHAQPAVKRSAATGWEPVCGACATSLDEAKAAKQAAEAAPSMASK